MSNMPKTGIAEAKPGMRRIRRRDLKVRVRAYTGRTQLSSPPDPAAVAEAQRRFNICKVCEHSRDDGFACELYDGCCFGKFRSRTENQCPQQTW